MSALAFEALSAGDQARISGTHQRWWYAVWPLVVIKTKPRPSGCCQALVLTAERVEDGETVTFHRKPDHRVELVTRGDA